MILTGPEILREVAAGRIVADPFDPRHVGPNSLDVTLAPLLRVYEGNLLDMRADNPTREVLIPEGGLILEPGTLYLASTAERVGSDYYVPWLDGRSSVGRLGIQIHMTAGRGDCGFTGRWTMEVRVEQPVRVYAGVRIGQVTFFALTGERKLYRGKYAADAGPAASRLWQDFANQKETA